MREIGEDGEEKESELSAGIRALMDGQQAMSAALGELAAIQAAPKEIIRDAEGRPIGMKPVI
jgi:hypothetical protein